MGSNTSAMPTPSDFAQNHDSADNLVNELLRSQNANRANRSTPTQASSNNVRYMDDKVLYSWG